MPRPNRHRAVAATAAGGQREIIVTGGGIGDNRRHLPTRRCRQLGRIVVGDFVAREKARKIYWRSAPKLAWNIVISAAFDD